MDESTSRVVLRVSRHDPHNIEIRSLLELGAPRAVGTTDVFLFLPKSLHLESFPKTDLLGDFRPRVRLAVPLPTDLSRGEGGEPALDVVLDDVHRTVRRAGFSDGDASDEVSVEAASRIVALVAATLKALARCHRQEAFYGRSLLCHNRASTLSGLATRVASVGGWLQSVRELVTGATQSGATVFRLVDEYLSHLFVQYLGDIRSAVEADDGEGAEGVDEVLRQLQSQEQDRRATGGYDLAPKACAQDEERHLVRLSQLKKYFQSAMLVDVAQHRVQRRVSETAAVAGAGLAALWAALVHRLETPEIAASGSVLLGSGVAAYILKDRIKDWSKGFLSRKASQYLAERLFLADCDQKLFVGDDEIGASKQWLTVGKNTVPMDVLKLRRSASLSEVEPELPEDVVRYRRHGDLRASAAVRARFGGTWAVQDTLRINIERYLKNMDDAYKTVTRLAPGGRLERATYHRVYPFYVVVRSRHSVCRHALAPRWRMPERGRDRGASGGWSALPTEDRVFRVIVDKNGIDRVEAVTH